MSRTIMSLPGSIAQPHVKGTVVRAHIQWVLDHFGSRTLMRILSILPARAAIEVNGALPSHWCSFESVVLLDRAIETICGGVTGSVARALGRYTAHLDLLATNTEQLGTAMHAAGRFIAGRYGDLHDFASCRYDERGEGWGHLVIANATASSRTWCMATIGFCEQTLMMTAGSLPLVRETTCRCDGSSVCIFEIRTFVNIFDEGVLVVSSSG